VAIAVGLLLKREKNRRWIKRYKRISQHTHENLKPDNVETAKRLLVYFGI
jgi:hypothetical protein